MWFGTQKVCWRRGERRQKFNCDTALTAVQQLYAYDLADVFTIARVNGRVIWQCDKETHSFVIARALL